MLVWNEVDVWRTRGYDSLPHTEIQYEGDYMYRGW